MTNMPQDNQDFKWFGVTMATVCIPFFFLVGFLNTTFGMDFWRTNWHRCSDWAKNLFARAPTVEEEPTIKDMTRDRKRSMSLATSDAIGKRKAQLQPQPRRGSVTSIDPRTARKNSSASITIGKDQKGIGIASPPRARVVETPPKGGQVLSPVSSSEKGTTREVKPPIRTASWWDVLTGGRKRRERGQEHNV